MTLLSLFALTLRVFSDPLPDRSLDALFLYSQTAPNEASVLDLAVDWIGASMVPRVLFVETPAMRGYPGFEAWRTNLLDRGVPEAAIEGVPLSNLDTLHTRVESLALVTLARARGYTDVAISGVPLHHLRAFMTAATVARETYPDLRLYSVPGYPVDWSETVTHSQGILTGRRTDLIDGELERLEKYHQMGHLASVQEILDYLDRRDAAIA